ncbi:KdgK [Oceaniovalibus guishaninsula JLT2003]|uniref:KdgK n=1 Tax=Oceaniovalibus guishaninsula JLT2003 TaxID=1231392 RepID=K2HB52_9RHOB|nr:sugar kinase [Oceaniovalibus guishaninsula]EKE43887.1 KdgK [Oceaniovalibus guishaninsula JLT2003]
MPTLLCLGECMVELAQMEGGLYRRGFAGDTFNTAWYARRLLPDAWTVSYGTAVGTDPLSDEMLATMAADGIGTGDVRRLPDRTVGLYMISLDRGERSFVYWRDRSAARCLADDGDWLDSVAAAADAVYFSGITLAILPPEGRARLCRAVARARGRGAVTAFDTNLRPRLWEDADAMRQGLMDGASVADIVLPGFDDDGPLFGDADPAATVARYRSAGARCVCVKDGGRPVHLWSGGAIETLTPRPVPLVDTTAAGDSFAAAFVSHWLMGVAPRDCAAHAIALSGHVVGHRGALVAPPG